MSGTSASMGSGSSSGAGSGNNAAADISQPPVGRREMSGPDLGGKKYQYSTVPQAEGFIPPGDAGTL